jgi:ABC-type sugar transport system ATPase subunit
LTPRSIDSERSADETLLEMQNITKTFPGVKALDRVNLT